MCGTQITGRTVGIVGLGRIGLAVAKRLRAFSIGRLLYSGRSQKDDDKEVNGEFAPLETLLRESDFVVVCSALTPETAGMFNKQAFAQMKKSAIFINSSRYLSKVTFPSLALPLPCLALLTDSIFSLSLSLSLPLEGVLSIRRTSLRP